MHVDMWLLKLHGKEKKTMKKFDIFTDSSCDLPQEMIEQYDIKVIQLEVIIDDGEPILNKDIDAKQLYQKLRDGAVAKTAAATPGNFYEQMNNSLAQGHDILYLGFTSALSVTYNNGAMMISELQEKYPNQKLMSIDTLCASVGQGLLVHFSALKREEGATLEETFHAVMNIKDKIHHQVTVDDLFFLKRGGRVSGATAIAGTMLNIKPMIQVSEAGKLETVGKVRGRKSAMRQLISEMQETADIDTWEYVFISHGDCYEDAARVGELVKEAYPKAKVIISYVGPVIGAHTGPGVIALCYLGKVMKGAK